MDIFVLVAWLAYGGFFVFDLFFSRDGFSLFFFFLVVGIVVLKFSRIAWLFL